MIILFFSPIPVLSGNFSFRSIRSQKQLLILYTITACYGVPELYFCLGFILICTWMVSLATHSHTSAMPGSCLESQWSIPKHVPGSSLFFAVALFSDAGFWVVEVSTLASAPKTDITDCTLNYSSLMWSLFWQDHGRLLSSSSYRRTYCMHLNSTSFHLFLLNKKKTMSPPDLKVQHLKWSFFISLQPASRFFPLLHFV